MAVSKSKGLSSKGRKAVRLPEDVRKEQYDLVSAQAAHTQARPVEESDELDLAGLKASSTVGRAHEAIPVVVRAPVADGPAAGPEAGPLPLAATPSSPDALVVGQSYNIPIGWLVDSNFNARVYYAVEEIDEIGQSLVKNGQDVPLWAYVDNGKVQVVDGGKRTRAGRSVGFPELRVDIHEKPASFRETYMRSRRMNLQRSAQTCLDDAVRFKQLLESGEFEGQIALGKELGISQTTVSLTLSLNKLPEDVLKVMRTAPAKLCQLSFAVEFAKLFDSPNDATDENIDAANALLREVVQEDHSLARTKALIQARTSPRRERQTASTFEVHYAGVKGSLKVFRARGQVELAMKGVPLDKMEALEERIKRALAE